MGGRSGSTTASRQQADAAHSVPPAHSTPAPRAARTLRRQHSSRSGAWAQITTMPSGPPSLGPPSWGAPSWGALSVGPSVGPSPWARTAMALQGRGSGAGGAGVGVGCSCRGGGSRARRREGSGRLAAAGGPHRARLDPRVDVVGQLGPGGSTRAVYNPGGVRTCPGAAPGGPSGPDGDGYAWPAEVDWGSGERNAQEAPRPSHRWDACRTLSSPCGSDRAAYRLTAVQLEVLASRGQHQRASRGCWRLGGHPPALPATTARNRRPHRRLPGRHHRLNSLAPSHSSSSLQGNSKRFKLGNSATATPAGTSAASRPIGGRVAGPATRGGARLLAAGQQLALHHAATPLPLESAGAGTGGAASGAAPPSATGNSRP